MAAEARSPGRGTGRYTVWPKDRIQRSVRTLASDLAQGAVLRPSGEVRSYPAGCVECRAHQDAVCAHKDASAGPLAAAVEGTESPDLGKQLACRVLGTRRLN